MTRPESAPQSAGEPEVLKGAAASFLAAIIASSDDAIISKDLNGIISSWNEGARRIFGYEASEMIGQSVLKLIPPDLAYEEESILRMIRSGERIDHFETMRMRKNGERFPVSVTISPIRDDAGKIVGASKILRDITDRRRMDDSRFRLAAIVDSADDAIISKDLNGIITSWNQGARRLFGYEAEEMIGQSIVRLIPEHLRYEEVEILRKLKAGEKIEHYETMRLGKDGQIRQVSITVSPIRNSEGAVIGGSKIARDVSDRKKVERLVIEAEKIATTGRMAAVIAHEINNPLASVLNLIFLARQEDVSREDAKRYLATAESELERVAHIAQQTLGYYRETVSTSPVHLRELVENVLTVYRTRLALRNIAVEVSLQDEGEISVRSGEIVQVLSNVLSNAVDAMPDGGRLSVTTMRHSGEGREGLRLTVRDTGRGIAPEHLHRIFEPFFTTKGDVGTGIGLWVSRQLVEGHGGQILVTSSTDREASGTTVSIDLPWKGAESGSGPSAGVSTRKEI